MSDTTGLCLDCASGDHSVHHDESGASCCGCSVVVIGDSRTDGAGSPLPAFGLIQIERTPGAWSSDGQADTYVGCLGHNRASAIDDLTPKDLKKLCVNAMEAALWIEAQA